MPKRPPIALLIPATFATATAATYRHSPEQDWLQGGGQLIGSGFHTAFYCCMPMIGSAWLKVGLLNSIVGVTSSAGRCNTVSIK